MSQSEQRLEDYLSHVLEAIRRIQVYTQGLLRRNP